MGPKTPRARKVIESVDNIEGALAWVAESTQRENVSPGSFGAKLWEAVDQGLLNDQEAGLMTRSLVGAGVDTTIYALGLTVNLLVDNPDQYAKLHAEPELGKFAFDEGMRWGSPVRQIWRTPSRDLEIEGIPVREEQKVMLVMGAANHDPERWGPTSRRLRHHPRRQWPPLDGPRHPRVRWRTDRPLGGGRAAQHLRPARQVDRAYSCVRALHQQQPTRLVVDPGENHRGLKGMRH